MTSDNIELSRRLIACKHFRWMPGMQTNFGARYLGRDLWVDSGERGIVYADSDDGETPDLSDPATLGCLLSFVRAAWNDEHVSVAYAKQEERFVVIDSACSAMLASGRYFYGDTEVEALIKALEAAP